MVLELNVREDGDVCRSHRQELKLHRELVGSSFIRLHADIDIPFILNMCVVDVVKSPNEEQCESYPTIYAETKATRKCKVTSVVNDRQHK
jgi:hypothetical protein